VCAASVESFKAFGFTYVTIDLQGFRSGSLNEAAPIRLARSAQVPPGEDSTMRSTR